MSRERTIKAKLLEAYKKLTIKRGFSQKKLNRIQHEAQLFESQLKPTVIDNIAGKALSYIKKEEPGIELDQWLK